MSGCTGQTTGKDSFHMVGTAQSAGLRDGPVWYGGWQPSGQAMCLCLHTEPRATGKENKETVFLMCLSDVYSYKLPVQAASSPRLPPYRLTLPLLARSLPQCRVGLGCRYERPPVNAVAADGGIVESQGDLDLRAFLVGPPPVSTSICTRLTGQGRLGWFSSYSRHDEAIK